MRWREIGAAITQRLFPSASRGSLKRLEAEHRAGVELYADGKYAESKEQFARSVKRARAFGAESSELIDYLKKLGDFYHTTGNYSSAERPLLEALGIAQKRFGEAGYRVAPVLNDLALLYYAQGRYREAEGRFEALQKILQQHAPQSIEMAICLENHAAVLRRLDREPESTHLRTRSRQIRAALGETESVKRET